jgi:hypothetical protein
VTRVPRRPLATTLVELVDDVVPERTDAGLRVGRLRLDLPLELDLERDGQLLGNVRRWRWPTDFDQPLSRLAVSFDLVPG